VAASLSASRLFQALGAPLNIVLVRKIGVPSPRACSAIRQRAP
jgi:predicted phosphoribosyltransferase